MTPKTLIRRTHCSGKVNDEIILSCWFLKRHNKIQLHFSSWISDVEFYIAVFYSKLCTCAITRWSIWRLQLQRNRRGAASTSSRTAQSQIPPTSNHSNSRMLLHCFPHQSQAYHTKHFHLIKINQEVTWLVRMIKSKGNPVKECSFFPSQQYKGRANIGRLGTQDQHFHP